MQLYVILGAVAYTTVASSLDLVGVKEDFKWLESKRHPDSCSGYINIYLLLIACSMLSLGAGDVYFRESLLSVASWIGTKRPCSAITSL